LELYANRRTGLAAWIWGVGAVTNVALNWLLLPRLGMLAAGLATLIGYALFLAPFLYLKRRRSALEQRI
jgi:O-antigen/teichoic acid export membrane protein